MVYVTGDLHGDPARLKKRADKRLKKGDTLICCGDFGFLWDGSQQEQKLLNWLGRRRYQLLFLDGTHDNLDLLAGYPRVPFAGGQARQISGSCYYLCRGEVFTLEDRTIFVMGGGESPDMDIREEGKTWWPGEMPSREELDAARQRLAEVGHQVDYILTHEPSTIVSSFLDMDANRSSPLSAFLDEISRTVQYRRWYFGSCHLDKVIPPRQFALYQEIRPLEG